MASFTSLNGFTEVLALATAISIIVGILTQIVKKFTGDSVNNKYMPLVSIAFGLIVGALIYPFTDMNLTLRLWAGFMAGLMASGLYDTVASFIKKKEDPPAYTGSIYK